MSSGPVRFLPASYDSRRLQLEERLALGLVLDDDHRHVAGRIDLADGRDLVAEQRRVRKRASARSGCVSTKSPVYSAAEAFYILIAGSEAEGLAIMQFASHADKHCG